MKVCKVVCNSVSHDARVLKEAGSIRDAGFDVVIIGISDANNWIPIETLDNGVVIRRVNWKSSAFRPSPLMYIFLIVIFLIIAFGLLSVIFSDDVPPVLSAFFDTLPSLLSVQYIISFLVVCLFFVSAGWLVWSYSKKKRRSGSLYKQEEESTLKYAAAISAHLGRTVAGDVGETSWWDRHCPRPLMVGIFQAFLPKNLRLWKVVFARERCILSALEEEKPDIVHAHDLSALPVAQQYSKAVGVKLVFDAHELYDQLAQAEDSLSKLNGKVLKKYQDKVDVFITINDSIAQYYSRFYVKLPKAVVIRNAVRRVDAFSYDGRLHQAAELPLEARILIYQGGFSPKRGLVDLLESVRYLDPSWNLVFMGWGKLERDLLKMADAMESGMPGTSARVRFIPKVPQSELPYWTAGASLGVIPYEDVGLNHWYCTPNKIWEYPNAGVPVLVSPFPEMEKIVNDWEIGWFLPSPPNPEDIARTINQITDEDLAVARENCRRFIENDHWGIYAERLKAVYEGFK